MEVKVVGTIVVICIMVKKEYHIPFLIFYTLLYKLSVFSLAKSLQLRARQHNLHSIAVPML